MKELKELLSKLQEAEQLNDSAAISKLRSEIGKYKTDIPYYPARNSDGPGEKGMYYGKDSEGTKQLERYEKLQTLMNKRK